MITALLAGLSPLVLCLVAGRTAPTSDPRGYATRAIAASSASLLIAILVAAAVTVWGASRSPLLGAWGIGFSIHVDALTATMLLLVSFVGLAVIRYSRNYLDGDPGHARFMRLLALTLASVQALIIAGNLLFVVCAFIATSLGLNALLLFYGERPAAKRAAAKKFVTSRLADLCLMVAALLLFARFGTMEIPDLMVAAQASAGTAQTWSLSLAAFLIVTTAMLKSAQIPLHGWLLEVMETPTPVSALLHAGIINAGGFLVLRLADVLLLAKPALELLALVGGATALIASLVMLTQSAVKVQLAWSTIAQMGFMLLQCGLGAFSSALLHIVAHSLYKAHAFLASGSIMDLARASWTPSPGGQPHPARLILSLASVIGVTVAIAWAFGLTPIRDPARVALGCVLLMGLVHLVANGIDERPNAFVVLRTLVLATAVAAATFALQIATEAIVATSLPLGKMPAGPLELAIAALVVISFAALTVFQNQMMRRADAPFWIAVYVHLKQGLYLNTLSNRLVLALRPLSQPRRASVTRNT